jgi:NAD(P)-dependent dehydrogenase (short-subunit alcohol dehydrogenase family)/glyoxylase-like metal-dependent hydrolase (beta-lactamase superfamily II)
MNTTSCEAHHAVSRQLMPAQPLLTAEATGGPVVLITGCSSGIGRATVTTLATAGCRVVATARDPATLDGVGAALRLRLDVTDQVSIQAAVDATLERFGRLDVLVNNAGYALRGAVEEVEIAAVAGTFDTNVLGLVRMVQAVAPVMRRQGAGRIINVGSLAGKLGGPANGTYAASKHAVEALNDALRWELAPFGIQVILVRPGAIASAFEQRVEHESGTLLRRPDSPYAPLYARVQAANAAIRATQPDAEAVAKVILAAIQAQHAHPRYPAAIPWMAQVAMALPDPAKDLVVRRLYALDGWPQEIAEGVHRLSAFGANVYFVGSGGSWVLVDAARAWGGCARIIRRAAESLFGPESRPAAILLTHLHPDHDGAALELARAWDCAVYVHPDELPLARAVAGWDFAAIERYGNWLDRAVIVRASAARSPRGRGEAELAEPSLVDVLRALDPASGVPGLPEWTLVPTPGHAPGHVGFFRARDRVLLTGDAALTVDVNTVGGCLAWALEKCPPHAFDAPRYTNWRQDKTDASLAVLAALQPRVLAPGHGPPLIGEAAARELRLLAEQVGGRRGTAAVAV